MPAPFTYTAWGRDAHGELYMTDGALLLRANLLAVAALPVPATAGVAELTAAQIAGVLGTSPVLYTPLFALAPSAAHAGLFRTADQVAVRGEYVRVLGEIGRHLRLGTRGPTEPIQLVHAGDVVGVLMPARAAPEPDPIAPPLVPGVAWPEDRALAALQANGLFGEFDGGTWQRLRQRVAPARDLTELARVRPLDVAELRALVAAHYGPPASPAACRDRVLAFAAPIAADELRAATLRFAAALGVTMPDAIAPTRFWHVADLLSRALDQAHRRERVWVGNGGAPFLIVRERVAAAGPFEAAAAHVPDPARDYLALVGDRLAAPFACDLGRYTFPATEHAPAVALHVLRRYSSDGMPDDYVHVVTDGFRARPLGAIARGSIERFELLTIAHTVDATLVEALYRLGRALHQMAAAPGAAPFWLGESVAWPEPGLCGHTAFYLSSTGAPLPAEDAAFDLAHITPISDAERAELRARPDAWPDGEGFVAELAGRDRAGLLARWSAPRPT